MNTPTAMMGMRRIRRIHFVGIGGSGMGGIAEVLANLGYEVTGSDLAENAVTRRLADLGVVIHRGHAAAHAEGADALVVSSAVGAENPEVRAAHERRIPVVPRAQMLAELRRFRYGIAVAGTHGKTTTTSLVASLLAEGGLDPTFVIGGRLNSTASHSRLGQGHYLVAEADESDASFLCLQPMISVVTNIDADHLAAYEGDFDRLQEAFLEFLHHLPFYGLAVLCVDDPQIRRLITRVGRPVHTYGVDEAADVRAVDLQPRGTQTRFGLCLPGRPEPLPVTLNLPGRHNVLNALAAVAVAHELGVTDAAIQRALSGFEGIGRRFQVYGEIPVPAGRVLLVDDYGHHPTEVAATLAAARAAWPDRRLVLAFQPHRYTRTRDLFEDFTQVLSEADALVLLEVYPAGEPPIQGADGRTLARAVRMRARVDPVFVETPDRLAPVLADLLEDGDVLLTQGAGNVGALAASLPGALAPRGGAA
ncbi:MAG: UDP-N-acetylmuramate--L-alanine ligase [Ectothiorhodospira sp.]